MIHFNRKIIPNHINSNYIAISGGVDSISASHFLVNKFPQYNWKAVHVNNNFIEQDKIVSDKVKEYCDNVLKIKCEVIEESEKINTENGSEAGCRDSRINGFNSLPWFSKVILCHHLDDAVESYLMNCLKGSGEYLPLPYNSLYNGRDILLCRPFIKTKKVGFEEYSEKNNLSQWVTLDPLNAKSMRGWMRSVLIPTIGTKYSGLDKVVWKKYLEKGYMKNG